MCDDRGVMPNRDLAWGAPRRSFAVCPLLLAGALAACGARSNILDASGASTSGAGAQGGGGASTTGQGGAGAQGGGGAGQGGAGAQGGGLPTVCSQLVEVGSIAQPASNPGFAFRDPLLLPRAQGGALLLARSIQLESPGPVPSRVDAVPFQPWGAWPPAFPAPKFAHPVTNPVAFAASMEPGGTFALGVEPFPMNAPPGCPLDTVYGISPDAPQWPNLFMFALEGGCEDTPLAVASAADKLHFAAADIAESFAGGPQRGLIFTVFDEGGKVLIPPKPLCASTPHVGDVIAGKQNFLFAHSQAPNGVCNAPGDLPGPASLVVLRRLSAKGSKAGTVYQGTDDLVLTRLLPRSEGAWLILRESGASAVVQGPALAMRISADDGPSEPFAISLPSAQQVVAAPLGDGFAVAEVDAIDPSAPSILLRVYSAEGELQAQGGFSTNGAWLLHQNRLALLGSPDGRQLVVGWIGQASDLSSSLFLHRFDCVIPE